MSEKASVYMRSAVYCRVSTEEQRERHSINTQHDFAEKYTELHGITPVDYYLDDGVSGAIPLEQRPDGARLLKDVEDGKIDTIYIWKLDRLGREARLILNVVNTLEELGCQVKSLTEPFDTSTSAGRFMLSTLSGVAGYERDVLAERTAAGMRRLAQNGDRKSVV